MMPMLLRLASLFGGLSLLSFGSGSGTLPAMRAAAVDTNHWLTAQQFVDLYAISRIAPGPNSSIVFLIGQRAAGLAGAAVAGLAMFVPPLVLIYLGARVWRRLEAQPWRRQAEAALAPVAVGLMLAGGLAVLRGNIHGVLLWGITLAATLLLSVTRLHPLIILGAGAAATMLLR